MITALFQHALAYDDASTVIPGVPFDSLAPSVLAGLAVLLVLTGRLVPRSTLQDAREDRDAWKASAQTSERQVEKLLIYAETADHILRSLPRPESVPTPPRKVEG